MIKDTNIRVFPQDAKLLAKLAKKERYTMKVMFSKALKYYQEENMPLSEQ